MPSGKNERKNTLPEETVSSHQMAHAEDVSMTVADPFMSDYDIHLFREGNHFGLYNKLGSHIVSRDGTEGVSFAVWAPNARRVSVIGTFNEWDKDAVMKIRQKIRDLTTEGN